MRRFTMAAAFALLMAGCGDDSAVTTTQPATTTTTTAAEPTTTTAASTADLLAGLRTRVADLDPDAEPTTTTTEPISGPDIGYTEYTIVTDDSGLIEVSVPVEWFDLIGLPWQEGETLIGPGLLVARDAEAWVVEWGTPGVFIGASDQLVDTADTLLDTKRWDSSCSYEGRDAYDDGLYVGVFDLYYDCGDEKSVFIVIAAEPPDGSFVVLVEIVVVTEADLEAADTIIRTWQVYGVDF